MTDSHGTNGIFTYMNGCFFMVNVGKYPMGYNAVDLSDVYWKNVSPFQFAQAVGIV